MKKFKTVKELYNTILPALKSRKEDLHHEKYVMITEQDIWDFLVENNWSAAENLELAMLVDDIMCVNGYQISEFIEKKKLQTQHQTFENLIDTE